MRRPTQSNWSCRVGNRGHQWRREMLAVFLGYTLSFNHQLLALFLPSILRYDLHKRASTLNCNDSLFLERQLDGSM